MYHETALCLPLAICQQCAGLAWQHFGTLFNQPGGNGTAMSGYEETVNLFHPLLRDILGDRWQRASVVCLQPSAQIPLHVDQQMPLRRYHIPLETNDACWSLSNGTWVHLGVGRIYLMNPTLPHGAVNWGETTRLHLMVDV